MSHYLVSCLGSYKHETHQTGGLILLSENDHFVVDYLDTTGLFVDDGKVFRYLSGDINKLIGFDENGIFLVLKLKESKDVHDILIEDNQIIVASTSTNEVIWYDFKGDVIKKWNPGGDQDAWHLNCFAKTKSGELCISAFGKFENHRGWNKAGDGKGIVVDIHTGDLVLNNLSGPHHPRFEDDKIYVCDSHMHSLNVYDANSKNEIQQVEFDGFTRGLHIEKEKVLVGINVARDKATNDAKIITLSKQNLEVINQQSIPFPEVYDIVEISESMATSIKENTVNFQISEVDEYKEELIKNNLKYKEAIKGFEKQLKTERFLFRIFIIALRKLRLIKS